MSNLYPVFDRYAPRGHPRVTLQEIGEALRVLDSVGYDTTDARSLSVRMYSLPPGFLDSHLAHADKRCWRIEEAQLSENLRSRAHRSSRRQPQVLIGHSRHVDALLRHQRDLCRYCIAPTLTHILGDLVTISAVVTQHTKGAEAFASSPSLGSLINLVQLRRDLQALTVASQRHIGAQLREILTRDGALLNQKVSEASTVLLEALMKQVSYVALHASYKSAPVPASVKVDRLQSDEAFSIFCLSGFPDSEPSSALEQRFGSQPWVRQLTSRWRELIEYQPATSEYVVLHTEVGRVARDRIDRALQMVLAPATVGTDHIIAALPAPLAHYWNRVAPRHVDLLGSSSPHTAPLLVSLTARLLSDSDLTLTGDLPSAVVTLTPPSAAAASLEGQHATALDTPRGAFLAALALVDA